MRMLPLTLVAIALTVPASASANWGSENWGELVWGNAAAVPLLPGVWLIGLLMGLLITGGFHVARGRRGAPARSLAIGRGSIFVAVLLLPVSVVASSVEVPNLFVNGTIADADQVNANFVAVEDAVNDNDARLTAVEAAPGVRAYAAVDSSGPALVAGQTFGFASIRRRFDGVYCLTPSDPSVIPSAVPSVATVNLGLSNAQASLNVFVVVRAPFVCASQEFEVLTLRRDDSSTANQVALVNDIGFNIMLP